MTNTYVFTGFPGYLASELIQSLFKASYEIENIYLIHLPSVEESARRQQAVWESDPQIPSEKIHLIKGDITQDCLGMPPRLSEELQGKVTHFFHLAALYDLAIPLTPAWKVNVQGTREVHQWLKECSCLERYIYFSTAYVSGRRRGIILEEELTHDEGFNNHYEYTKYEAERLVDGMRSTLPVTIIRPGIVVGHSKTGETAKFDGPYFVLNLLDSLKHLPFLPYFGEGQALVNLVPQDYVLSAATYLAHAEKAVGRTYHLTDPNPYTAKEIYEHFSDQYRKKQPRFTVPVSFAREALRIKPLRQHLRIQKEALDYFSWGPVYDSTHTQTDLQESSITCPDFFSYTDALIHYYKREKDNPLKHVSIF
ncbi:SDR family oxidoreductase [Halobacillus litoralis]|uniref:SDR family oxidoreductase n=1 Tax=Halobacillus litoralis TaxID=45668 RepID=UPI001CFE447F|nr:SDR family oxidoreductase [Halobacillus litoralis]